ncbi:hypothetical protein HYX11_02465 [Candidatus Woesearchaeota archaeon]|nr:hypothetical protein [Candidatus Woesearchaeota archaeon]
MTNTTEQYICRQSQITEQELYLLASGRIINFVRTDELQKIITSLSNYGSSMYNIQQTMEDHIRNCPNCQDKYFPYCETTKKAYEHKHASLELILI